MNSLIEDAIYGKKIYQDDGEQIQKKIDEVNFLSPRGREDAIKSCIKHMAKCKRIIQLAIREDKKQTQKNKEKKVAGK